MSQRTVLLVLSACVLILGVSWIVRTELASRRCAEMGLVWDASRGCVPDPASIILERDLKRS